MKKGLGKAVEIIKAEQEVARELNVQMALGMAQVLMLIEQELKNN